MPRRISLFMIGVLFIAGGIAHFAFPATYTAIMPSYLPWQRELVYLSGVFEVLGGVGILIPVLRGWAGWGLVLLLIAVFPANIAMLTEHSEIVAPHFPLWVLWMRLPLQGVLIAWIAWASGLWQSGRPAS